MTTYRVNSRQIPDCKFTESKEVSSDSRSKDVFARITLAVNYFSACMEEVFYCNILTANKFYTIENRLTCTLTCLAAYLLGIGIILRVYQLCSSSQDSAPMRSMTFQNFSSLDRSLKMDNHPWIKEKGYKELLNYFSNARKNGNLNTGISNFKYAFTIAILYRRLKGAHYTSAENVILKEIAFGQKDAHLLGVLIRNGMRLKDEEAMTLVDHALEHNQPEIFIEMLTNLLQPINPNLNKKIFSYVVKTRSTELLRLLPANNIRVQECFSRQEYQVIYQNIFKEIYNDHFDKLVICTSVNDYLAFRKHMSDQGQRELFSVMMLEMFVLGLNSESNKASSAALVLEMTGIAKADFRDKIITNPELAQSIDVLSWYKVNGSEPFLSLIRNTEILKEVKKNYFLGCFS